MSYKAKTGPPQTGPPQTVAYPPLTTHLKIGSEM